MDKSCIEIFESDSTIDCIIYDCILGTLVNFGDWLAIDVGKEIDYTYFDHFCLL